MIAEKYGLKHLSTGELLRNEVAEGTELGRSIDSYVKEGNLVPDALIIELLSKLLKQGGNVPGYIFDGFPRTYEQAVALKKMLAEHGTDVALMIYLDVEEEELVKRLLYRGITSGRSDDNEATIQHRIQVYNEVTVPVRKFYEQEGCAVNIQGSGSLNEIFGRICRVIDERLGKTSSR